MKCVTIFKHRYFAFTLTVWGSMWSRILNVGFKSLWSQSFASYQEARKLSTSPHWKLMKVSGLKHIGICDVLHALLAIDLVFYSRKEEQAMIILP